MDVHELLPATPPACSCGRWRAPGSPDEAAAAHRRHAVAMTRPEAVPDPLPPPPAPAAAWQPESRLAA